jgi:hypothetical protein
MASRKSSQRPVKKSTKKGGRKKGLLITLIVLIVVIGGGLVKMAIEKVGSQVTQTAVRVRGVHIHLKEGSASIEHLTVGNPKGFELPYAFSLEEIGVDVNPKSLTGDEIGIDDIVIRTPEIFVEVNGDKKTNLNEIKENLPAGSGAPSKSKEPKKKGKEKQLFIRRILFDTGQIYAKVVPMNNKEYRLKMGTFEMRDLRGTPRQIAVQMMNRLISQALAEVKKKGIGQVMDTYGDKAKSELDTQKKKAADTAKKGIRL